MGAGLSWRRVLARGIGIGVIAMWEVGPSVRTGHSLRRESQNPSSSVSFSGKSLTKRILLFNPIQSHISYERGVEVGYRHIYGPS